MVGDLSNIALAVAAMIGLIVVMIQFGFDMVDHGSPENPEEKRPKKQMPRNYKKAA
jgi:hypothetical protein